MANNGSFGRRINPQALPSRPRAEAAAIVQSTAAPLPEIAADHVLLPAESSPSLDDELREWKQGRKQGVKIPWRQVYLMASLCFGIASIALPSDVNDGVNWLLYGLMAASLYAGFSKRREKAKKSN